MNLSAKAKVLIKQSERQIFYFLGDILREKTIFIFFVGLMNIRKFTQKYDKNTIKHFKLSFLDL